MISANYNHALTILGAGAALNSSHSKTAVLIDGTLMVDAGADPVPALNSISVPPVSVRAVLVTHLHGDHFFGLTFLIAEAMAADPATVKPLLVYGPSGVAEAVTSLLKLAYPLSDPNSFIEKRKASFHAVSPGDRFAVCQWEVDVLEQNHGRMPGLAYILTHGEDGTTIGFTGDGNPDKGSRESLLNCAVLVANTPTQAEPLPAHASVETYRLNKPARNRLICIHRAFEAEPEPDEGILYPVDMDTIPF